MPNKPKSDEANKEQKEKQAATQAAQEEHAKKAADPVGAEQDYKKSKSGDETKSVDPKDGKIEVTVKSAKDTDEDPSREVPLAVHTTGTEGVHGIAAGSSNQVIVPTGNETGEGLTHGIPLTGEDKVGSEKEDVRDLTPNAKKEAKEKEEKEKPADYGVNIDDKEQNDLTLADAAKQGYNALVDKKSGVVITRKGSELARFVSTEENENRVLKVQPAEGSISDEEAEVLNSYHQRIVAGHEV